MGKNWKGKHDKKENKIKKNILYFIFIVVVFFIGGGWLLLLNVQKTNLDMLSDICNELNITDCKDKK